MGCFTFTDARRTPRLNARGYDFIVSDKITYGGYAKIVCPDDTEIVERCYDGYGMFDGQDIYDLVVDWNKEYLTEIFDRMLSEDPHCWGADLKPIAEAYQNDDPDLDKIVESIAAKRCDKFLREEWKRNVGIAISCEDKNNAALPYPVKITSLKWHRRYDDLYPSMNCQ